MHGTSVPRVLGEASFTYVLGPTELRVTAVVLPVEARAYLGGRAPVVTMRLLRVGTNAFD